MPSNAVRTKKATRNLDQDQVTELLYQALETEMGGIQIYTTAIKCADNDELRHEWEEYLEQTQNHERILRGLFETLSLDPERDTPGRAVVRHLGQSCLPPWTWPSRPATERPPNWSPANASF